MTILAQFPLQVNIVEAPMPEFNFDLTVSNISPEQASDMLTSITLLVEFFGGQVAGGFAEADDEHKDAEPAS